MNFLFPRLSRSELALILRLTFVAALLAGFAGIVHDEITYTLGPEYFSRVKFHQFSWADMGLPPRVLAGEIGFLAAFAAGAAVGWFLARLAVPAWPPPVAVRKTMAGFGIVFLFALAGGVSGFLAGRARRSNPDFGTWDVYLQPLQIQDPAEFVWVAYVHNASYLGGLAGLLVAATWLILEKRRTGRR